MIYGFNSYLGFIIWRVIGLTHYGFMAGEVGEIKVTGYSKGGSTSI